MRIDDQDRIWVTEYRGNKVAMFDPRTEKFVEYPLPAHTYPYRSAVDKNGEIWTGGMHTDRVVRYDPKTNRTVEYPLPHTTNIRSVWMDDTTIAAHVLDRQQSRRRPRQGRAARLSRLRRKLAPASSHDGAGAMLLGAPQVKSLRDNPMLETTLVTQRAFQDQPGAFPADRTALAIRLLRSSQTR